jgi:hypothetical protein
VICAALWFDPANPLCPEAFVNTAKTLMLNWAKNHPEKASAESFNRLTTINKNPKVLDDPVELRKTLLDFYQKDSVDLTHTRLKNILSR